MPVASCEKPPPFRVRTITAFLQLPPEPSKWEIEISAAGTFLSYARHHLEAQGYEVQTVRIATQPFLNFLAADARISSSNNSHGSSSRDNSKSSSSTHSTGQQIQQQQQESLCPAAMAMHDIMVTRAVLIETLAAKHGIPLVSLGTCSDPQYLPVIPQIIRATSSTSCTFLMPQNPDWGLAHQVAEAIMQVAGSTDGMGNFRFGSASNMQHGIPYFPVACCGPAHHRTFAIGTESDTLLYRACSTAATRAGAAAAAMQGAAASSVLMGSLASNTMTAPSCTPPAVGSSSSSHRAAQLPNMLQLAGQELQHQLLEHWTPLEAAALHIEQEYRRMSEEAAEGVSSNAVVAAAAHVSSNAGVAAAAGVSSNAGVAAADDQMPAAGCKALIHFTYLGLDSSLAPGLDTPPLTTSYRLLLRGLSAPKHELHHSQHAHVAVQLFPEGGAVLAATAGKVQDTHTAEAVLNFEAADGSETIHEQHTYGGDAAAVFGRPGSLTISSMITRVLKELPLKLTGYCGLMLAVCEDQGLAAAAASGDITISQLLQYSAVCGCGLDTVPVPGPAGKLQQQQHHQGGPQQLQMSKLTCAHNTATTAVAAAFDANQASAEAEVTEAERPGGAAGVRDGCYTNEAAARNVTQDALITEGIAGLLSDVNTLAYRLNKPLACRLLPLPGKAAGDPTGFHHPFMINSRVMDLHR